VSAWESCRFLTCSVLPVRVACDLACRFCFSRSSVSALRHERAALRPEDVLGYYRFARERGATRLVITGGGEPLLRAGESLELIRLGRQVFDEVALFTNGTRLTEELSAELAEAGLSYLCLSRHHQDDDRCRDLMGDGARPLAELMAAARGLRIRATCVMARGFVEDAAGVDRYVQTLAAHGVREFTFKHTYVAHERSLFRDSPQDRWTRAHQVSAGDDPLAGQGTVVATLPWGPAIRQIEENTICFYWEPTPAWELQHRTARSSNLLSDGAVYASLEDTRSLLYRLPPS
jgi:pyruvate-formate lyase-activating enzyme